MTQMEALAIVAIGSVVLTLLMVLLDRRNWRNHE